MESAPLIWPSASPLLMTRKLEQQLGVFFRLCAGFGIDDRRLSDVLQSQGLGIGKHFLLVTDQDDVGQPVRKGAVGGRNGPLLKRLGEHDALPVGPGTRDDSFNQ